MKSDDTSNETTFPYCVITKPKSPKGRTHHAYVFCLCLRVYGVYIYCCFQNDSAIFLCCCSFFPVSCCFIFRSVNFKTLHVVFFYSSSSLKRLRLLENGAKKTEAYVSMAAGLLLKILRYGLVFAIIICVRRFIFIVEVKLVLWGEDYLYFFPHYFRILKCHSMSERSFFFFFSHSG